MGTGPQSTIRNSLAVSSTRNPDHFPYRDAILTLNNTTDKPISAVRLRWRDGGPTMQFPLAIPPNSRAERTVFLPALSASQTYDIGLLTDDSLAAPPIAQTEAAIHWPVARLTKDAFLDPVTWQECYLPPPSWSRTTKTTALFAGIVIVLAFAATFLFRRNKVRFRVWTGIVVGSSVGAVLWCSLSGEGGLRVTTLSDGVSGVLVQTRRTGEYLLRDVKPQSAPLYAHESEIREETLIVHPDQGLLLTLRPDETRIFLTRREGESRE
ncbi:MAG: hypothetical protein JXA11_04285 [Phycisphaerae bacterium]|nr:hypothetical protein [Phycisphaerae bacterium]